jgi:hypothetical protein
MNQFEDDIFVIGEYVNLEKKEKTLISLIESLKQFNIPILLSGHYPVKPEIQRMVNYYLFDAENPILSKYDFEKYSRKSAHVYVQTGDWIVEIFADGGDYAEWLLLRNAVNFVNYLGKKNIHYIVYDNVPDTSQYLNEFLAPMRIYDASVLTTPLILSRNRYLTYIFSIKTNIAMNMFNKIKTQEEYYKYNHADEYFMENVFFRFLNDATKNIYISQYKSTGNDLALHGASDGNNITTFLVCDDKKTLYGNFRTDYGIKSLTVLIDYGGIKKECVIKSGYYIFFVDSPSEKHNEFIAEIGEYKIGETVKIYYEGIEIFNTKLNVEYDKFKDFNKITFKK